MPEFISNIGTDDYDEQVYIDWFKEVDISDIRYVCDDVWPLMANRAKEPMSDLIGFEFEASSPVEDFIDYLTMATVDVTLECVKKIVREEIKSKPLRGKVLSRMGINDA